MTCKGKYDKAAKSTYKRCDRNKQQQQFDFCPYYCFPVNGVSEQKDCPCNGQPLLHTKRKLGNRLFSGVSKSYHLQTVVNVRRTTAHIG